MLRWEKNDITSRNNTITTINNDNKKMWYPQVYNYDLKNIKTNNIYQIYKKAFFK